MYLWQQSWSYKRRGKQTHVKLLFCNVMDGSFSKRGPISPGLQRKPAVQTKVAEQTNKWAAEQRTAAGRRREQLAGQLDLQTSHLSTLHIWTLLSLWGAVVSRNPQKVRLYSDCWPDLPGGQNDGWDPVTCANRLKREHGDQSRSFIRWLAFTKKKTVGESAVWGLICLSNKMGLVDQWGSLRTWPTWYAWGLAGYF